MTTDCCRTVAAAVLGDTAKEKFVPLSPRLRVTVRKAHDETIISGKVGDCQLRLVERVYGVFYLDKA